jgi:hypothetical protein
MDTRVRKANGNLRPQDLKVYTAGLFEKPQFPNNEPNAKEWESRNATTMWKTIQLLHAYDYVTSEAEADVIRKRYARQWALIRWESILAAEIIERLVLCHNRGAWEEEEIQADGKAFIIAEYDLIAKEYLLGDSNGQSGAHYDAKTSRELQRMSKEIGELRRKQSGQTGRTGQAPQDEDPTYIPPSQHKEEGDAAKLFTSAQRRWKAFKDLPEHKDRAMKQCDTCKLKHREGLCLQEYIEKHHGAGKPMDDITSHETHAWMNRAGFPDQFPRQKGDKGKGKGKGNGKGGKGKQRR